VQSRFISYVDRGHLATAGPAIEQQLGLSESKFGLLITAFHLTYVAGMIPAGWLAERFGGYIVLAIGVAVRVSGPLRLTVNSKAQKPLAFTDRSPATWYN
jgi:MFS family permease